MLFRSGFDDRANGHAGADVLLHGVKILTQRGQRNFCPGSPVQDQRPAIGHLRQIKPWSIHITDYSDRANWVVKCRW